MYIEQFSNETIRLLKTKHEQVTFVLRLMPIMRQNMFHTQLLIRHVVI